MLVARNADQLANAEQDVRKINSQAKVLSVSADVSDEASVNALFEKVKAEFGTADVLVNNAGTLNGGPIEAVAPKTWWSDFVRTSSIAIFFLTPPLQSSLPSG